MIRDFDDAKNRIDQFIKRDTSPRTCTDCHKSFVPGRWCFWNLCDACHETWQLNHRIKRSPDGGPDLKKTDPREGPLFYDDEFAAYLSWRKQQRQ